MRPPAVNAREGSDPVGRTVPGEPPFYKHANVGSAGTPRPTFFYKHANVGSAGTPRPTFFYKHANVGSAGTPRPTVARWRAIAAARRSGSSRRRCLIRRPGRGRSRFLREAWRGSLGRAFPGSARRGKGL